MGKAEQLRVPQFWPQTKYSITRRQPKRAKKKKNKNKNKNKKKRFDWKGSAAAARSEIDLNLYQKKKKKKNGFRHRLAICFRRSEKTSPAGSKVNRQAHLRGFALGDEGRFERFENGAE